jgi:photosystem II stability/assembly factor-like uncharacterized protein
MLWLAVDPRDANTVYAAYNGAGFSVRKSTDGGQTWSTASAGIPSGTAVFGLTIDPRNPQILYASTTGSGAFRSTNGGASWTAMNIEPVIWGIAIDAVDSTLLYAATNGNGVYRSADSGATWKRMGSPSLGVVHALIKVGTRLVAGTASDGIYISDDEGATWQRSDYARSGPARSNSAPPYLESMGLVLSLSADASGRLYAGTGRQGVWISNDRGKTWDTRDVNLLLTLCNCQNGYGVSIGPSPRRSVYFATNDGGLFASDMSGILAGRWSAAAPTMIARAPRAVVFNPVRPDSLYAGSFAGSGFFKSDDGGQTWQRRLFGPPTLHVTNVAVTPDGGTIFAMTQGGAGVWKSTDGGDNFQRIDVATAGGPFLNLAGRGIAVDPLGGPNVYVAAASGVWRSRDRGATWSRVSTVGSQTVQVHPLDPSIVLVGTPASGVLKSTDSGATFTAINTGLTELRTGRLGGVMVHRSKPDTYYVNTEGGGIFKSTDAGATWKAINKNLGDLTVFGLTIDPSDPDTLLAATPSSVWLTRTGGE